MKDFIIFCLALLASISIFGQQSDNISTYFDNGSHQLTSENKSKLDPYLFTIPNKEYEQIIIIGHADANGSLDYNQKLSQLRAISVREYLIAKGLPSNKVSIQSHGESKPIASNADIEGRQKNRRVDVNISYIEKKITNEEQADEPEVLDITKITKVKKSPNKNFSKIFPVNPKVIQYFEVSANEKIKITGKKGTVIKIPKDAFTSSTRISPNKKITIELVEIHTKADMILNNIQTTSNGQLLESGGMIFIKATQDNKELSLKRGQSYTIEFPSYNRFNDMTIFYGQAYGENINWIQNTGLEEETISTISLAVINNNQVFAPFDSNRETTITKNILSSSKLGWISCDRFLRFPEKTNLIVKNDDTADVHYCLVFESINSVMNANKNSNTIIFNNVPVGLSAKLIAFKKTDNEIMFGSKDILLKHDQEVTVVMLEVTEEEFMEMVEGL